MDDDLTRRTLLATGAAAAAVAGLTACTSTAPAATRPQPAQAAKGHAPAQPAGGASSGGAAGSTGVTVPTAQVPVGGGTILENAPYVVTQPTSGTYRAFNKTCTHEGCPVSKIVGTEIVCVCHNSKFSIVDGSVTQPPARRPLAAAKVELQGTSLLITD